MKDLDARIPGQSGNGACRIAVRPACIMQPEIALEAWRGNPEARLNVKPFLFGQGDGSTFSAKELVLLTADARALCAWRKFISGDGQQGINCAMFRREGGDPASELLAGARLRAWSPWPGERLYTYVDPLGVKPTIRAGRPT